MGVLIRVGSLASVLSAALLLAPTTATAEPFTAGAACSANTRAGDVLIASVRPAHANVAAARPVTAQAHRNDTADMTFASRTTTDGSVQVDGRGGDLVF